MHSFFGCHDRRCRICNEVSRSSGHRSLFNFHFPQCVSLRSGLNTSSTWRFKALMTPMRADIVGPPLSATSMRVSKR
jgi:hypothetical protein